MLHKDLYDLSLYLYSFSKMRRVKCCTKIYMTYRLLVFVFQNEKGEMLHKDLYDLSLYLYSFSKMRRVKCCTKIYTTYRCTCIRFPK